ncbi:MAG: dTDP-4-dehydrorhamnose 3,5-epimerase [Deltaproteobacteria bacterium]|nr:dTDP-4-dehydrorhamnose 3,5-epimerase [Deltaproteobacteria bacterium]
MSSRFIIAENAFSGLKIIERRRIEDTRGYLERLFCAEALAKAGWDKPIAQINHTSTTCRGTVRGMHFQHPPNAEMKLVMCLKGEIFDVAVDLRAGSPTFLKWHGETLSADNGLTLLIPKGFAHGFQTLSHDVEMLYFHSSVYTPETEGGVHPMDSKLAIQWPIEITEISARDAAHSWITDNLHGVKL